MSIMIPANTPANKLIKTPPTTHPKLTFTHQIIDSTPSKSQAHADHLLSPAFSSPVRNSLKYHGYPSYQSVPPPFPVALPIRSNVTMSTTSINPNTYAVNPIVHARVEESIPIKINNNITNKLIDSDESDKSISKKKKSKKDRHSTFDLNSHEKPPYSYATLIGISILTHENKRLTLSQIYSWISNTFKYYKREDVGWQNSIRHNLSLNKAFIKGEKSKDGKGHFWCIKPGFEDLFLKSKLIKKTSFLEVMEKINNSKSTQNNIPSSPVESSKRKYDDSNAESSFASIDNHIPSINVSHDNFEGTQEDRTFVDSDKEEDHHDQDDEDLTQILPEPKRQKLGDPFWEVHKPGMNPLASGQSTPKVPLDSSPKPQLAGKNLTYTSSFSCNSNFEFSPIRPNETGPLLEPITPGKNFFGMIQPSVLPHIVPPQNLKSSTNNLQRTPKQNIIKTPLRNLKTPQSNTMNKLWNSPSYLEEFYYSPIITHYAHHINSYDDDDMILRNLYPSPQVLRKLGIQRTPISNDNKSAASPDSKRSVMVSSTHDTEDKEKVESDGTDED